MAGTPLTRYPQDQVYPPGNSACWEILETSGRYASYWNAFLFNFIIWCCVSSAVVFFQVDNGIVGFQVYPGIRTPTFQVYLTPGRFLPPAKEVWGQVIFSQVRVCPWGVSVWSHFLSGCLAPCSFWEGGVSVPGPMSRRSLSGRPPRHRHSCTVKSEWYASSWNAFLFVILRSNKTIELHDSLQINNIPIFPKLSTTQSWHFWLLCFHFVC